MDYNNNIDISNDNEPWDWNEQDYYLTKDPHLDISHFLWDAHQNERLPCTFDETTPVKACGDLAYNVGSTAKNTNKEAQVYCSQAKRRRMLQFDTQSTESLLCTENTEYTFDAFDNSQDKEEDLMEDVAPENIPMDSGFYGGRSASCDGSIGQSSDAWLSNCFNDGAVNLSLDDMNASGFSDDYIDISEFCNLTDEMESDTVKVCPTPPPKIVVRGRKPGVLPPTNLASSVAYPFALIKPCGVHGDVTLKDINQRILTPTPFKLMHEKDDDPAVSYPTSAFSGKPVVVKTKIRTEGGKGSITIMRTKG